MRVEEQVQADTALSSTRQSVHNSFTRTAISPTKYCYGLWTMYLYTTARLAVQVSKIHENITYYMNREQVCNDVVYRKHFIGIKHCVCIFNIATKEHFQISY